MQCVRSQSQRTRNQLKTFMKSLQCKAFQSPRGTEYVQFMANCVDSYPKIVKRFFHHLNAVQYVIGILKHCDEPRIVSLTINTFGIETEENKNKESVDMTVSN